MAMSTSWEAGTFKLHGTGSLGILPDLTLLTLHPADHLYILR